MKRNKVQILVLILTIVFVSALYAEDIHRTLRNLQDKVDEQVFDDLKIYKNEELTLKAEILAKGFNEKYSNVIQDTLDNKSEITDLFIKQPKGDYFDNGERIYIFMSSSVPFNIWRSYAEEIDKLEIGVNVYMVLRGCIGGCEKLKPTMEFMRKVLIKSEEEKTGLACNVVIDPFLFRTYHKKETVPCFVYTKGLGLVDTTLSEGLEDNIETMPKLATSCEDWNFYYHLEKLYEETNSKSLKRLLAYAKENKFYNNIDVSSAE